MNTTLFLKSRLKVTQLLLAGALFMTGLPTYGNAAEGVADFHTGLKLPSGYEWDEPIRRVRLPYADLDPYIEPAPAPAPAPGESPSDPIEYSEWLHQINAVNAWKYSLGADASGNRIKIALLDTGVDFRVPGIAAMNKYTRTAEVLGRSGFDDDNNGYNDDKYGWNFVNRTGDINDGSGHGTHIAGILAGRGQSGIYGIASDAEIMSLKVLDNNMNGQVSYATEAIYYAVNNGARVLNLSLSAPTDDPNNSLRNAVDYATSHGAIVVTGSGNDGGLINGRVPSSFENVITVGGLRLGENNRYSASNYGPELDFVAPATRIASFHAIGTNYGCASYNVVTGVCTEPLANDPVVLEWGTSLAAPMVSGTVALMLARNPMMTFSDVYRSLQFSSTDLGDEGRDDMFGWGLIDAARAVAYTYFETGTAQSYEFTDAGENLFLGEDLLDSLLGNFLNVSAFLSQFVDQEIASIHDLLNLQILRRFEFMDEVYLAPPLDDLSNMLGYGRISRLDYSDGSYDRLFYDELASDRTRLRSVESYGTDGLLQKMIVWIGARTRIEYMYYNGIIVSTNVYDAQDGDVYLGWLGGLGEISASQIIQRLAMASAVQSDSVSQALIERLMLSNGAVIGMSLENLSTLTIQSILTSSSDPNQQIIRAQCALGTIDYNVRCQNGTHVITSYQITIPGEEGVYEVTRMNQRDEILWSVWNGTGLTYSKTIVTYSDDMELNSVDGCSPWPACQDSAVTINSPATFTVNRWSLRIDSVTHQPISYHSESITGSQFAQPGYSLVDTLFDAGGHPVSTTSTIQSPSRINTAQRTYYSGSSAVKDWLETNETRVPTAAGTWRKQKIEKSGARYSEQGNLESHHYLKQIFAEDGKLIYQVGFVRFANGEFLQVEYELSNGAVLNTRLLSGAKIIFEGIENRPTPNPVVLRQVSGHMDPDDIFQFYLETAAPPPPIVVVVAPPAAPAPAAPDAVMAAWEDRNAVLEEQAEQAEQVSHEAPVAPHQDPFEQA